MISKENLISLNIPQQDLQEINFALTVLRSKLVPHLITLSVDEKVGLAKMGDKTLAFVTKALEQAIRNQHLVPSYVNVPELQIDYDAVVLLRPMLLALEEICKLMDDTITQSGSEAYVTSLAFYNAVGAAAKANVPGAQTIYDELSVRFDYHKRKKNPPKDESGE